jgi:hypothetical protein
MTYKCKKGQQLKRSGRTLNSLVQDEGFESQHYHLGRTSLTTTKRTIPASIQTARLGPMLSKTFYGRNLRMFLLS